MLLYANDTLSQGKMVPLQLEDSAESPAVPLCRNHPNLIIPSFTWACALPLPSKNLHTSPGETSSCGSTSHHSGSIVWMWVEFFARMRSVGASAPWFLGLVVVMATSRTRMSIMKSVNIVTPLMIQSNHVRHWIVNTWNKSSVGADGYGILWQLVLQWQWDMITGKEGGRLLSSVSLLTNESVSYVFSPVLKLLKNEGYRWNEFGFSSTGLDDTAKYFGIARKISGRFPSGE